MKKNSSVKQSSKQGAKRVRSRKGSIRIGMDLGDKTSRCCALDQDGEVLLERSVVSTKKGMAQLFGALGRCRVALEVGTHSPWVSRLVKSFGHEGIVANARQVKRISQSRRKDDKLAAQMLARLARIDPELLRPIQHRSEQAQLDLTQIRVRAALVEARTMVVNSARGLAKARGERLPKCDANSLAGEKRESLPVPLQQVLQPLLEEVASLTEKIHACDKEIEQIARTKYPETELLRPVSGVGDRFEVRVDGGRGRAFPEEPGCGLLGRVATPAQRVRQESAATGDQ